jgi:NAD(P)-dependent dehydrogenase (short-subunit alcohol dehydrogenase family)
VVTGVTAGIGRVTAARLAGHKATVVGVVGVVGDPVRARVVTERIRALGGRMDVLFADLSQMAGVRRLAKAITARCHGIDVLVNNAGVAKFPREITADGLETTFATNRLARFLPTNLLRDQLIVRAPARVVTVASSVHGRIRAIPWDDLQARQRYDPNFAYGLSKLLNLLFIAELARRLAGTGVTANSVHPGFSRTDLARGAERVWRLVRPVVRPFQPSPERAPRSSSTRRKRKRNKSTKANTPKTLKRLVQSSILYLIWASIGAIEAIILNLPAQFGGSTSGLPVVQDFLYGSGTALSPPLLQWMVPQALLTWLAWNQTNRRSTWGVIGLTFFGALLFIGALGEPITYEVLNPVTFNPLLAVIQAGMIIIPFVMMVFAIQEWRRRRSETKQKENPTFLPNNSLTIGDERRLGKPREVGASGERAAR